VPSTAAALQRKGYETVTQWLRARTLTSVDHCLDRSMPGDRLDPERNTRWVLRLADPAGLVECGAVTIFAPLALPQLTR
jgi:hypothetical protein